MASGDSSDGINRLIAWGEIVVGIGFVIRGYAKVKSGNNGGLLGKIEPGAALPRGNIIEKATMHRVANIDQRVALIKGLANAGSLMPVIREKALEITTRKCGDRWCVQERDHAGEISALFWSLRDPRSPDAMRYIRDHVRVDQFHGADKLLKLKAGDCFVKGTRVLRDDYQLVAVESLRVGERIWGRNTWTRVENTWEKGVLPTWHVKLNNDLSMRLTSDHKVYTVVGDQITRVRVRDLVLGDVLLRPDRIPFGEGRDRDCWPELLRVVEVLRDNVEFLVYDIATADHYVWLYDADWTVSNCDDGTILLGALLMAAGYPVKMRIIQEQGASTWTHIYLLAGIPPGNPTKWIPLDWSVENAKPGWEAPGAREVALSGKPAGLVERLKDYNLM